MHEDLFIDDTYLCDKHLAECLETIPITKFVHIHAQPGLAFCKECVKTDDSLRTNLVPYLYRVKIS